MISQLEILPFFNCKDSVHQIHVLPHPNGFETWFSLHSIPERKVAAPIAVIGFVGVIPAFQAMRLKISEALRRVG